MMPSDWNIDLTGQPGQPNSGPQGAVGPGYLATSTTSLPVASGPITIATQVGLAYLPGTRARIVSNSDMTQWMEGQITAYSSSTGSMSINVDLTSAMVAAVGTLPTLQIFTGGSGTYTTPTGCARLEIEMVGGGGGGANTGAVGGNGTNTTFGTLLCNGGQGGVTSDQVTPGNLGGAASNGDINIKGEDGGGESYAGVASYMHAPGNRGGASFFGGAGRGFPYNGSAAAGSRSNASPNTGSGGGGGGTIASSGAYPGQGGSAGGYLKKYINGPAATYSYVVGAGGAGAALNSGNYDGGGNGAAGIIIVREFYL